MVHQTKTDKTVCPDLHACQLLHLGGKSDKGSCTMEAVRSQWSNPSAAHYCSDIKASGFIKDLHTKLGKSHGAK